MRLPVVSTATIGVREVLADGESGFVVPTGDSTRLAERILDLARDPGLRAKMGARARERILGEFTRDHMLTRVERLLGDLALGSLGSLVDDDGPSPGTCGDPQGRDSAVRLLNEAERRKNDGNQSRAVGDSRLSAV